MSEAEYFIRHLVPAESMIVDPMMGSGTTLVAAINCGMNVVGVEQDPVTFAMAKKRIEDQMAQLEENSRKNEGA
jgi:DNA modification methylase